MTPDAAEEYLVHPLNTDDERIRDRRGPTGVIPVSDGTCLLVGYAAS
ncbi:hypothetical protein OG285_32830 [Streptomyces sp. NBC_01471]